MCVFVCVELVVVVGGKSEVARHWFVYLALTPANTQTPPPVPPPETKPVFREPRGGGGGVVLWKGGGREG